MRPAVDTIRASLFLPSEELIQPEAGQAVRGPRSEYQLLEKIGQGAFGTVWRAQRSDRSSPGGPGDSVAIKIVRSMAEAEIEAGLLQRVPRGRGIPLHEVFEWESCGVLVMAFAPLGTLRDHLETLGIPPVGETLRLARHLARALHAVHSAGLVHLDLKPSNIVFGPSGLPYLCDWGGAASLERDPGTRGTRGYVAPERLARRLPISAEAWRNKEHLKLADAYSFGVILTELLTGERPDPNPKSTLRLGDLAERLRRAGLSHEALKLFHPLLFQLTATEPAKRIGMDAVCRRLSRSLPRAPGPKN